MAINTPIFHSFENGGFVFYCKFELYGKIIIRFSSTKLESKWVNYKNTLK
jgi:hypothetical protein